MAEQTCSSCGSTMPQGAVFCTQCGSRDLVAGGPAVGSDATQVVTGGPGSAPAVPSDPDPTQVVPQPESTPTPAPGGYAAPEATPAAAPPPPAPTADPTQSWSAPPAAPAEQGWTSAPGTPPPSAPPPPGMAPSPPGAAAPQPVAPPAPPTGAGWQAPTQTWDQPPAAPAPVAPAPPYPGAPAPQQYAPYPGAPAPQQYAPQPGAPAYPAYAPGPVAAPKAAKTSSGGKFGAFIGLIGGALAIVGSFLAWVKIAPANDVSYTVTGWNLSNDAKIAAAIGAGAIVLAMVVLFGRMRGFVRLLFVLGGIAMLGLAAYDTYDILKKLPDRLAGSFPDGGAKITGPGIGLILIYAGGALLFFGALMMKKRKADVQGFTQT